MRLCLIALLLVSSTLARHRGASSHGTSSHSYPAATGLSGTGSGGRAHSYPLSNGGSGNYNNRHTYPLNQQSTARYNYSPKTEVHHHYHYSPPQQITYGSSQYTVFHGSPPVYIYEYRDSGSRFDSLLTGLALYNLGRMSATSHNQHYDSYREYRGTPGEICKLGISKRTGEYEETGIDCKLMSSFIWDVNSQSTGRQVLSSNSVSTTIVNTTSSVNGSNVNTSVVTVKNETATEALKTKGPSIKVTPDMVCYMIHIYRDKSSKKNVECGLLQKYAESSLRRNNSGRLKPMMMISFNLLVYFLFLYH